MWKDFAGSARCSGGGSGSSFSLGGLGTVRTATTLTAAATAQTSGLMVLVVSAPDSVCANLHGTGAKGIHLTFSNPIRSML